MTTPPDWADCRRRRWRLKGCGRYVGGRAACQLSDSRLGLWESDHQLSCQRCRGPAALSATQADTDRQRAGQHRRLAPELLPAGGSHSCHGRSTSDSGAFVAPHALRSHFAILGARTQHPPPAPGRAHGGREQQPTAAACTRCTTHTQEPPPIAALPRGRGGGRREHTHTHTHSTYLYRSTAPPLCLARPPTPRLSAPVMCVCA